jgi:Sulfotransferase domain
MSVIGIYSFPKSGNTWLRRIIADAFEGAVGENLKDVPDLYGQQFSEARVLNGFQFYKSHGRYIVTAEEGGPAKTTHVVHIRRNPLDVFMSYMNYISGNVTNSAVLPFESVEAIAGSDLLDLYFKAFIISGHVEPGFAVTTGSYFEHNADWLSRASERIRCIRYEDMLHQPAETLAFLKDWLALEPGQLERMLDNAAADTRPNGHFFWRQIEKNYFNFLTDEQVALFLKYRGEDCRRLGYDPKYLATRP